jgi:uncharacterized C2H2 Zn-finger protein
MTLPFEKYDPNVRKYCCFVCGRNFKTFDEYNNHIIDSHEEGREYVRCPLERCGACIRDVRAHFKAIHKGQPIPQGKQMKSLVWTDQSDRKKKTKKPTFREGYFVSEKNGGKKMHYRSGYECEVYEALETLNEVAAYDVEPFSVQYFFNGEEKKYFPDLSVQFTDGHVEIWEVKPKSQTDLEVNDAKWIAASNYSLIRGWDFKVITEKGIEKLKKGIIV